MTTAFVKEGAEVAIVDLNEETSNQTIKELQASQLESIFIQANLTEHMKITDIVTKVIEQLGELDILVDNAHASRIVSFHEFGPYCAKTAE